MLLLITAQDRKRVIKTTQNITGTIYRAPVTPVKWDVYTEPRDIKRQFSQGDQIMELYSVPHWSFSTVHPWYWAVSEWNSALCHIKHELLKAVTADIFSGETQHCSAAPSSSHLSAGVTVCSNRACNPAATISSFV